MAQAPAKADPKNAAGKGTQPPDERFWVRYSPHHEAPLSLVASLSLHVSAVLLLVLLALWAVSAPDSPAAPPRMDLAEIEGGELGVELGVGVTPKGSGPKGSDAENVAESGGDESRTRAKGQTEFAKLGEVKGIPLTFRASGKKPSDGEGEDPFPELDKAARQATERILKATQPPPPAKGAGEKGGRGDDKKVGPDGPKGNGGGGKGSGTGSGAGKSTSGPVLTEQGRRQLRWQILASADGKVHLDKLKALKVTLVAPTRDPGLFTVYDLQRTPLAPKTSKRLEEHADKVWWVNRDPVEVQGLARVLGLRETPPCFVIFLPKALEDRMAQLELQYQGAREGQIEKTVWDVPLREGRYASEPQVVKQLLKRQR
jgi:hypothetical protein